MKKSIASRYFGLTLLGAALVLCVAVLAVDTRISQGRAFDEGARSEIGLAAEAPSDEGILVGSVTFQSRGSPPSAQYSVPLQVQLLPPGSVTATYSTTVQSDQYGHFTSTVPSGTYTVTVRDLHSLPNARAGVVITTMPSTTDFCLLQEGDADSSLQVNVADYSILSASYGKVAGQPGFDSRADFNENGQVNIMDLSLQLNAFGKYGYQTCGPVLVQGLGSGGLVEQSSGAVEIGLIPSSQAVGPDQIITAAIQVQAGSQPVDAVGTYLNFDPAVFQVVDASGVPTTTVQSPACGSLSIALRNIVDNNVGQIDYALGCGLGTYYPAATGTFTIGTIYLKVMTATAGSDISFAFDQSTNRSTDVRYFGAPLLGTANGAHFITPLRGVVVSPTTATASGNPGTAVVYALVVTNTGNFTDTFDVSLSGNAWSTAAPASIGPLGPAGAAPLNVTVTIPANALAGATERVTVTVRSRSDPGESTTATLTTTANLVRGVRFNPNTYWAHGDPGSAVSFTIHLTNTGNITDTFTLATSGNSWPLSAPASVGPTVPFGSATIVATLTIPSLAFGGQTDTTLLTATSLGDASIAATATLTTVANTIVGISLAPPDDSKNGDPGTIVSYTLSLTNTGNVTDTFDVSVAGNQWPVGAPATIGPLAPRSSTNLSVAVTVPVSVPGTSTDWAGVTVSSRADPTKWASAALTTTADIVRGVTAGPLYAAGTASAGTGLGYTVRVTNTGNYTDSFGISVQGNSWPTIVPQTIGPLASGASAPFVAAVLIPVDTPAGTTDTARVTVCSAADAAQSVTVTMTTTATAVAGIVDLALVPSTGTLSVGDILTAAIQVQAGAGQASGVGAYLDFDPGVFQVVDAAGNPATQIDNPGTPLEVQLQNSVDNSAGRIDYAVGTLITPYPSGTFTVGVIYLKAIAPAQTGSAVMFSYDQGANRRTNVVLGTQSVLRTALSGSYSVSPIADIIVRPEVERVAVGGTFTASLQVNAGAQALDSVRAYLNFDPGLLEVVDEAGNPATAISLTNKLPVILQNAVDNLNGHIDVDTATAGTLASGAFTLGTIWFKVVTSTETAANVNFAFDAAANRVTDIALANRSVLRTATNGSYTIVAMPTSVAIDGPQEGMVDVTYTFTATTDPISAAVPLTYTWQATGQTDITHIGGLTDSVSVTWALSGTKLISVTVSNDRGTVTAATPISLYVPVKANMVAVPVTGSLPLTVSFGNLSSGDFENSLWDFGDGVTSTLRDPVHTYGAIGTYTASLTVAGPGGTDTAVKGSYVSVTGNTDLALVPGAATIGLGQTFTVAIQVASGSQQVDGVAVYLDFDPSVFQVVDSAGNPSGVIENAPGNPLTTELLNSVDNAAGKIDYAVGKLSGTKPNGTFQIGVISFEAVVNSATATSVIFDFDAPNNRLTDVTYYTASVLRNAYGGAYDIVNGILEGSVQLQGREVPPPAAPYSVPLRVQLVPAGSVSPTISTTVSTDLSGTFSVVGIMSGTYTVAVKNNHTLANVRPNVSIIPGVNVLNLCTLQEGDASDDNQVNILDFSILAATFGKSRGDPGFDPRADFNESGQISIMDFSLLSLNFGKFGDRACTGT